MQGFERRFTNLEADDNNENFVSGCPIRGKNVATPLESSGWDGNVALVKTRYCLTQQVAAIPSPTSQHLHRCATPHATSTRRCIK